MNYIYDIVLCFNNYKLDINSYEWNSTDRFTYIEKIPIYRISDIGMNEINNHLIKIDRSLLEDIHNKTYTKNEIIDYSLLVTDMNRVVALKFDSSGLLIEKSMLLIDEEDAAIEEASLLDLDIFNYNKLDFYDNELFLTRNEKNMKIGLIEEIEYLFNNKMFDEINYLYYEVFSVNKSIKNKYLDLIQLINNNSNIDKLYSIVKMTKEKSY